MNIEKSPSVFADDPSASIFDAFFQDLLMHDEVLSALLAQCDTRDTRGDGIPTILILEDYFSPVQPARTAAPGDEGMGLLYALWLTALAAKVASDGKETTYPPACPAMSALAEKFFRIQPYQDSREDNV